MFCPQCHDGELVKRRNKKNGQTFYGCSTYPACKFAVASLDRLKPTVVEPAVSMPSVAESNQGELIAAIRELTDAIRALATTKEPT